jgi:hypothetical protein
MKKLILILLVLSSSAGAQTPVGPDCWLYPDGSVRCTPRPLICDYRGICQPGLQK